MMRRAETFAEGEGYDRRPGAGGEGGGDCAEVGVSDWRERERWGRRRCGRCRVCCGCGRRGLRCGRSMRLRWQRSPMVVEIYTRLMTGAVNKSSEVARTAYLRKKRRENAVYAGLSRGVLEKARASEDAFDALVSAMVMVEHRGEFAGLKRTEDEVFRMEGHTWVPGVGVDR